MHTVNTTLYGFRAKLVLWPLCFCFSYCHCIVFYCLRWIKKLLI